MRDRSIGRRDFLRHSAALSLATAVAGASQAGHAAESQPPALKKALLSTMLPGALPEAERFKLAKDCGFEAIETLSVTDLAAARQMGEAARAAGIRIHSLCYGGWEAPLSHPDPEVAAKGVKGLEAALRSAKAMEADAVLLVPAVVKDEVTHEQAYERSQANIRKVLPLAEELKVVITVENVWNNFLLRAEEFARYVDEFNSPWLRAYFDTGNCIIRDPAEDWIRTLGNRIAKVHLKDFRKKDKEFVNLGEGDVNWPAVRKALHEIGYAGYVTPELAPGDEAYLRDLSARIDKCVLGA